MTAPTPLKNHPINVLLVDDQPIIAESVKKMLANEDDISLFYCQDSAQALDMAIAVQPTVILQDLVMPDIDGKLLCRYYRANQATHNVPMIVLSATEDPKTKAEAFALGANDYIVKLPDKLELLARIRYHSNAYIGLLQRNEAYEKLAESQKQLNNELSEAAEYVRSLLPEWHETDAIKCCWRFVPSTQLGGDAFGYLWLDDNNFAIFLLDVCGHGIRAALLSISVMNVMRSRSLPGVDFRNPKQVFNALNETFPMEKQNNMFFTMWYGVVNTNEKTLSYSCAGHPPALLIRKNPHAVDIVKLFTPGLVIGGATNITYNVQVEKLLPNDKLLIFSDGIYEIQKQDGNMMHLDEFIDMIKTLSNHPIADPITLLDEIFAECSRIQSKSSFVDDCSLLSIDFNLHP